MGIHPSPPFYAGCSTLLLSLQPVTFIRDVNCMLLRICNYCGKRIPVGQQCDCKPSRERDAAANRAAQRRYDRFHRDKEAAAFYASVSWHRTRQTVWARAFGLDEYIYHTTGKAVPADTVHHIVELNEDKGRAYDLSNLICVSKQTHKQIHLQYRKRNCKKEMQNKLFAAVGAVKF